MKREMEKFQEDFQSSIFAASLQGELPQTIIPIGNLTPQRVCEIYRNDYFARLGDALGETFESVWMVLGDEDFQQLCKDFIKATPSLFRDLGQYGRDFPAYIRTTSLMQGLPFLFDLAQFELQFWDFFHAPTVDYQDPFTESVVARMEQLSLVFPSTTVLWQSEWDIFSLWKNRHGRAEDLKVDWNVPAYALLYRTSVNLGLESLTRGQFLLLKLITTHGQNFAQALEEIEISAEEVQGLFQILRKQKVPLSLE